MTGSTVPLATAPLTRGPCAITRALVVVALVLSSGAAGAQEVIDPAEDAPVGEREQPTREPVRTQEAKPPRAPPTLEERRIHQLRQLEARLSVGQALSDEERKLLGQVAVRGETPRARALATMMNSRTKIVGCFAQRIGFIKVQLC